MTEKKISAIQPKLNGKCFYCDKSSNLYNASICFINLKISLPTGTKVKLSIVEWPVQGSWQIDIDIYPSLSDVNNTEGLCGTLDGRQDNDFTRRTGTKDSVKMLYPDDFSNSWK